MEWPSQYPVYILGARQDSIITRTIDQEDAVVLFNDLVRARLFLKKCGFKAKIKPIQHQYAMVGALRAMQEDGYKLATLNDDPELPPNPIVIADLLRELEEGQCIITSIHGDHLCIEEESKDTLIFSSVGASNEVYLFISKKDVTTIIQYLQMMLPNPIP